MNSSCNSLQLQNAPLIDDMLSNISNMIQVRHFVNPHLFWYEKVQDDDYFKKAHLKMIEEKLELYVNEYRNGPECVNWNQNKIGDSVAVYYEQWHRYVRGNILNLADSGRQNEILIWLTDYGIPVYVKAYNLYPLNADLKYVSTNILCGGIANIVPAELKYDFVDGSVMIRRKRDWLETACRIVEDLLKDAIGIHFVLHFQSKMVQNEKYQSVQNWGDLIITNRKCNTFNVKQILKSVNHAIIIHEMEFIKICTNQSLQITKVANWQTNDYNNPNLNSFNQLKSSTEQVHQNYENNSYQQNFKIDHISPQLNNNDSMHLASTSNKIDTWRNRIGDLNTRNYSSHPIMNVPNINGFPFRYIDNISGVGLQSQSDYYTELANQHNYIGEAGRLVKPSMAMVKQMQLPSDTDFEMAPVNRGINVDINEAYDNGKSRLLSIAKRFTLMSKRSNDHENFDEKKKSMNGVAKSPMYANDKFRQNQINENLRHNLNQNISTNGVEENNCISADEKSIKDLRIYSNIAGVNISPAGFDRNRLYKYRDGERINRVGFAYHKFPQGERIASKDFMTADTKDKSEFKPQFKYGWESSVIKFNSPKNIYNNEMLCCKENQWYHRRSNFVERNLNMKSENSLKTKFLNHLVLAHTNCTLEAIEHIDEVEFLPIISKLLHKLTINKVLRIQVYSWSHVLNGNSFFVINPRQSGKTWSYLPAVCNQLWKESKKMLIGKTYGPATIIMASSAKEVEEILAITKCLMFSSNITILASFGIHNFREIKVQLLNGCDVLIVTVSSLKRILIANKDENLINHDRLDRVIIDNMDEMLERYYDDFVVVVNALKNICWNRKKQDQILKPQFIVTSKTWHDCLMHLIKVTLNPLLVIGDFLEAAVYGKTTLSIKLCAKVDKDKVLVEYIQNLIKRSFVLRTLIICSDVWQIKHLSKIMWENGFRNINITNSTEYERQTVKQWQYSKTNSSIIICADDQLPELRIQKAQILIHYALPSSWTLFNYRFSTLIGNYSLFNQYCKDTLNLHSKSVVFLDEENNKQLPRLVDFMRKHNQIVDSRIVTLTKNILLQREKYLQRKGVALCDQVLDFGECIRRECKQRHSLSREDVNDIHNLPQNGIISLYILKVCSPTYYFARILEHRDASFNANNNNYYDDKWKTIRRSDEVFAFSVDLNLYYNDAKNLIVHWPPILNDICIYKYQHSYQRARITQEPSSNYNSNVIHSELLIQLTLIDIGEIVDYVKSSEIYECAPQFKEFPNQAVEIRLSNIVPYDNERTWDLNSTEKVRKWIIDDIKNNSSYVIHANINFVLSKTIWVHNLVVLQCLNSVKTYSQVMNVKRSLIALNYAMIYETKKSNLKEEAYQLRLDISNNIDKKSNDNTKDNFNDNLGKESLLENSNDKAASICQEVISESETETVITDLKAEKDQFSSNEENIIIPNLTNNIDNKINNETINEIKNVNDTVASDENCSKIESWCKLNKHQLVKVEFYDEIENGNWENFFVQLNEDNDREVFNELTSMINKHVENLRETDRNIDLMDFHPLANFIVRHEDYYFRAKLCGIFGSKNDGRIFRFFLCDGACMVYIKEKELSDFCYPTTDEIIHFTPYQSVHCQLIGIKWDAHKDRCQLFKKYCFIYPIMDEKEMNDVDNTISNVKSQMKINSYSVLLFECDEDDEKLESIELMNTKLIVECKLQPDPNTQHFLNLDLDFIKRSRITSNLSKCTYNESILEEEKSESNNNNDKKEGIDWEGEYKNVTNISFKKLVNYLYNADPAEVLRFLAVPPCQMDRNDNSAQSTEISDDNPQLKNSVGGADSLDYSANDNEKDSLAIPSLKVLYKPLKTTWCETDWMLVFSIYAPNILDYDLKVKNQVLLFGTKDEHDVYGFILHLLGKVSPEKTTHEIRGSYIIVRLVKSSYGMWPRLLKHKINYTWLSYDFSVMEIDDKIMIERFQPKIMNNNDNDDNEHIDTKVDSDESDDTDDIDRYT